YKEPVTGPIYLKDHAVTADTIGNKKVHGGEYKACYLFSSEHYPYWKEVYPSMDWNWGMFGENVTTEGLLDSEIHIGDIFKIGSSIVQATIPREPCYKLGVKFNDQHIIETFIAHGYPGTYVKILEEGEIKEGDIIEKLEAAKNSISIAYFFKILNTKDKERSVLLDLIENPYLPKYKKERFSKLLS
ncbi:MAG: MOSC domain-containing protein, partial [Eudoraea sp.]|nr:MOSC domain-containing protein [Eudoraea sp.]